MWILFLLIVGVVIYFLFSQKDIINSRLHGNKTPEDLLKERFVNGEIDVDTYKKMKETIND